ncbi:MAG: peptide deformylase, peptide deformylase [Candidatus Taylorbacteria bacterium]|nr:peptide deformylase, peptide deformylase [Candidatus Taylorbacteria bacterium]
MAKIAPKEMKQEQKRKQSGEVRPIVQSGDPVLRELAQSVSLKDIGTPRIDAVIADMKITLAGQKDGVAIAAPQIGVPLRIFVVSGAMLKAALEHEKLPTDGIGADLVFINPTITKLSRDKMPLDEGCLSVRWLYGKVKRSVKATVRAYNERGEIIERGASGLLAQIFQHETDHLEGTLFIDKATQLEEIPPEKKD